MIIQSFSIHHYASFTYAFLVLSVLMHFQLQTLMSCCNDHHEELCLLLKQLLWMFALSS